MKNLVSDFRVNNVLLIVVSYNPDMEELKHLLGLLSSQGDLCLVDNGSENSSSIKENFLHLLSYSFFLPENIGLAAALNKGIELAIESNFEVVVLFDQDSVPKNDFVLNLHEKYQEISASNPGCCAVLGPRLVDPDSGALTPFKEFTWPLFKSDRRFEHFSGVFQSDFVITSGSYIPLEVLKSVGLMKEEYFIDNVDLEWCFRAKSLGFSVLGCDDAVLYHAIGEVQDNTLSKILGIKKHKPYRSYYTTKNRLDLYKKSYVPTAWKFRDFVRFLLKTLMLIVFDSKRAQYFRYITLAIKNSPID